MNSKEIVESFIQKHSKNYKKFFISMIIADVALLAILIFVIFNIDEEYSNYVAYTGAAMLMITLYINLKVHFGSYRGYIRGDNLTRFYKQKKKKLEKIQKKHNLGKVDESTLLEAQKSFDKSIEELARIIKSQDIKDE